MQPSAFALTRTPGPGQGAGTLQALIGVAMFAATLPATRIAVAQLDPVWVALVRVEIAAVVAAAALWLAGGPRPARRDLPSLALTALGVVLGFPLFTSIAMTQAGAAPGAIVTGLLPVATAAAAALRGGERPSARFVWLAVAGAAVAVGHGMWQSGGGLGAGHSAMLAAVLLGALGYAEGGRLAARLGGWQTIAWALVLAAPLLALPLALGNWEPARSASPAAWGALAYLALVSQFVGFAFWYGGMARAGVARVSQLQLLQPFLTLLLCWPLLGETVPWPSWIAALAVVAIVVASRRTTVNRPQQTSRR